MLNLVLTRHRCCNRDSCPEFSKTDFRRMQKLPRISNLLRRICRVPKIVGKRISESSLAARSSKWFFVSQNPNCYFPLFLDRFSLPDILITSNGIGFRNLRQILVFSLKHLSKQFFLNLEEKFLLYWIWIDYFSSLALTHSWQSIWRSCSSKM